MRAVLDAVRDHPDLTSRELAARESGEGLDRFVFARRLPDLEKQGLVTKRSVRACAVGRKLSVTWMATELRSETRSGMGA